MDIQDTKKQKEMADFLKAYTELAKQRKKPDRYGMIQALSDAQNVAFTEITNVEHQQGDVIPMLWSEFSDQDLYRKLTQYQQGMIDSARKKFGEELAKKLLSSPQ